MLMLALVITIIIVDTLFRPHLTIMSFTIYMHRSVHKKNPIKIGEGEKLVWWKNEYVLTHTQLAHYVFTTLQFGCCLVRSLSYVKITLPQRILDT